MANKTNKTYIVGGKQVKLYTIGELSRRLDRQHQTIRKWERDGIIPPAQFRSKTNRRLYTEAQINAIVKVVERYGLKQGSKIPDGFKEDVYMEFNRVTET